MDFRGMLHLRVLYYMLPKQFQDLLEKFSRGVCSQEEAQLIADWYNRIGEGAKDTLPKEEKNQVEQKLWAAINPATRKTRSWLPLLTRAAIITVPLLAGAFFYLTHHPFSQDFANTQVSGFEHASTRFKNDGHIREEITLPDGSEAILQPASEITLSDDFGQSTRKVQLKGEAFFRVERDERRPFLVYSDEVVTKVLGTSFNIRAYEDDGEITVAVRTGKVSVYASKKKTSAASNNEEGQEVILTPNQQMVYHRRKDQVSKRLVEKPEIILPDSNLFRMQFENAGVSEIFQVLEENYGIEIQYDKNVLDNCRLTTSMSDEGLYERIEIICKAIGASYTVDNDAVITIKSNGC